jgi:hypothetical protein
MRPDGHRLLLPSGAEIGPRLIVEAKDHHDYDASGRAFADLFEKDLQLMAGRQSIAAGTKDVFFTMLRDEHFEATRRLFGTDNFDRLFVVHAFEGARSEATSAGLAASRVFLLDTNSLIADLLQWYETSERKSGLRNSLIGDVWHLLVGFCRLRPEQVGRAAPPPTTERRESVETSRPTAEAVTGPVRLGTAAGDSQPAVREFQNAEQEYLGWLRQHPDGLVVNTERGKPLRYRVLHRASCPLISEYIGRSEPGGFTERTYIKLCSTSNAALCSLMPGLKRCSRCDPG